ncbi:GtrA family protein [Novosphingobium jiangmenense]|uniref:GtrA family protein n=1 Tax=Novosphingobium jiangmenense TaxID=2791981 RepID=A0ABS0HFS2_9SPHN|nr:GtrA family protein [Novosphingobium jiangmenense]MBF9150875.1 GtrA family protein [Novosphingobium jiangmenense]
MTGMILPMIDRLRRVMLLRYLLASVGALAVDMGSFLALLAVGSAPVIASASGYSLGILAHWLLSSRAVFTETVAAERGARNRQKALFVGSALVGLALTTLIVGVGTALGLDSRASKIVAVGASFTATWLLRKRIVFQ